MMIFGAILIVLGLILHIQILWIVGLVLVILGAILMVRPVGGRRWY